MRLRALATAVVTAFVAVVVVPSPPVQAATRAEQWRARAETALARFEQVKTSSETPHALAYAAQVYAWLSPQGWQDPTARAYLAQVRAERNPDGGYGLGFAYDFGSDGTVNPANTTYSVTIADHVGPTILDAYRAGVVDRSEVKTLVDLLMSTPRIVNANSPYGQCVAYSRSQNDNLAWACIHNVSAGVARFLVDANAAGVGAGGLQKLVVDISRREIFAYLPVADDGRQAWWRYGDSRALNDADHNAYSAESVYYLAYHIGREAAYQHMVTRWQDNSAAPLAHMRLVALPGGPGSMSADGSTTLWCVLGDQWLGEFDQFVQSAAARQAAQAAYFAARNARACAVGQPAGGAR